MERDLELVSGRYKETNLPRKKEYYLLYFSTEVQELFLRYYMLFGRYFHFSEHTGYLVSDRYLKMLKNRFDDLEAVHQRMEEEQDFEKKLALQEELRTGKFKYELLGYRRERVSTRN